MNKEIEKAMSGKKEPSKLRKWWRKNDYKVWRVVLFPIWIGLKINEKIEKFLNSRNKWNEERANEIFQYYIPRRAEWCAEEKEFYFFDNGFGWGTAKKYLKRKDRRFWRNNIGWGGGKLRNYLLYHFELEGFTKEVVDGDSDWTEIIFKLGVDK